MTSVIRAGRMMFAGNTQIRCSTMSTGTGSPTVAMTLGPIGEMVICPGCGKLWMDSHALPESGACDRCQYENPLQPGRLLSVEEIVEDTNGGQYQDVDLGAFAQTLMSLISETQPNTNRDRGPEWRKGPNGTLEARAGRLRLSIIEKRTLNDDGEFKGYVQPFENEARTLGAESVEGAKLEMEERALAYLEEGMNAF